MKTNDLYRVTEGFIPFYKVPNGELVRVYTWQGYSKGQEHYSSNIICKTGLVGGHLNSQPTLDFFLNLNELVKLV